MKMADACVRVGFRVRYEHINFIKVADKSKTSVWACRNNQAGAELGRIRWYGAWRQYCYFPVAQAVYSRGCLEDIAAFLKDLADVEKT